MYVEDFYCFNSIETCDLVLFSFIWFCFFFLCPLRTHRLTAPDAVSKGGESGPLMVYAVVTRVFPVLGIEGGEMLKEVFSFCI